MAGGTVSNVRKLSMAFSGGEMTPEFWGQIGDAKYQSGLAECRNMLVLPHGPVANRPGFAYVNTAKTPDKRTRVIPFTFSTTQTMVLEFGERYIRFHTQGATLKGWDGYYTDRAYTPGNIVRYGASHYRCVSPASPGDAPGSASWVDLLHNGTTSYKIGDLASAGLELYYCYAANTASPPATNPAKWSKFGADAFEVTTPYLESDLFGLRYVQSADILTICHPNYPPMELRRNGQTSWPLVPIAFASSLSPPTGVTASATGSGGTPYSYVITSMGATGLDESAASTTASCTGNLLVSGQFNTIGWASTGATRYGVYKQSNGLYGYIGQTDGLSFKDDNITANLGKTPPIVNNPFSAPGTYPGAVSYFEQRRCFAGSINEPQNLRMTRSGTESNMTYSIPVRDDDSINIRVAAREANTIRHIVPLQSLVLLTGSAEWRVTSINSDAITPTSVSVKPQSYVGANNAQPLIVNNSIIYVAARGGHLREMAYSYNAGGYTTGDLSLRAPHLFDGLDIVDLAYSKAPIPLVWGVSTSGKLIGLTYVPEQQIGAIHQHDTDGAFESCCVVAEGTEDVLYVVVKRTISGLDTRYIERMASRRFETQADAFFVDSGATYTGAPTTTISGLSWLEGKTVSILGDGAVMVQRTVAGGSVTIERACSKVQIGLPITADARTLPVSAQIDASFGQGRLKNVNRVWLRVVESSGFSSGPALDRLVQVKQRTTEAYGTPPKLVSDEVEIVLEPSWQSGGQIYVRQSQPLPLTLVSMTVEASLGG